MPQPTRTRTQHRHAHIATSRFITTLVLSAAWIAAGCTQRVDTFDPTWYPDTPAATVVETHHGVEVPDPYRWLEDEQSPQTQAWITAQNALTERTLAPFDHAKAEIAAQLAAVYDVDSSSNIYQRGQRFFFTRRAGLENHAKIYLCDGSPFVRPEVVLDPNTFSEDGTVAMDWWYPSPDGSLIAYGKSSGGTEKSTLYIRNVDTGRDLHDVIPYTQYCSVAWNKAGTGFYYNRSPNPETVPEGEENFHMRVYFHKLGTPYEDDRYVWGKGRPIDEEPKPYASSDHQYVLLNFYRDPSENDLYFGQMGSTVLQPVSENLDAITRGDVVDDTLFLITNYDAPRYRICKTSAEKPTHEHWKEIIPQQKGVIEDFQLIGGRLVVHLVENVHSRLLVYDLQGTRLEEIPLPAMGSVAAYASGIGTVQSFGGSWNDDGVFFTFSSWIVPTATYRYDLKTKRLEKIFQTDCPIRLDNYETRQIWCTSKDGTRVPMFVVARKDLRLDGDNPTLLYGYGGFNVSFYPYYRPRILPFLEQGGVWVLANIRGGGEFGAPWHESGRRQFKQNVFDDFYAAAEELIRRGYTNPRRLACKGGSNGGLLIGAAVTQRPDLFQAAISQVPLMDMLRFHHWGMGAQWVHEYGDPATPDEFAWLRAYSPYHNVRQDVNYPATLIVTAEGDNRVDTAHAYKQVARMQAATSGIRPILLRVERKAGHGAGKPLRMRIEHQSEDWTFLMWQLGMLRR